MEKPIFTYRKHRAITAKPLAIAVLPLLLLLIFIPNSWGITGRLSGKTARSSAQLNASDVNPVGMSIPNGSHPFYSCYQAPFPLTEGGKGPDDSLYKETANANALPQIESIYPPSGPAGTGVTISGTNSGLARVSSNVSFDSVQATEYTSWMDTEIHCKVPSWVPGTRQVTNTTWAGSSNQGSLTITPNHWNLQDSGTSVDLIDACALGEHIAWAAGGSLFGGPEEGVILKTVDGEDWENLVQGEYSILGISAVNAQTAWVAAGALGKTTDGGHNWDIYQTPDGAIMVGIWALDENTAWAVGFKLEIIMQEIPVWLRVGYIYKVNVVDGIAHWELKYHDEFPPPPYPPGPLTYHHFYRVAGADANHLWAVGASTILHGNELYWWATPGPAIVFGMDIGESWIPMYSGSSPAADWGFTGVSAADASHVWVCGENGQILKSENGGLSWAPQASGTSNHLSGICSVDRNTAWAVGFNGTILKTTDGGLNWTPQGSPTASNLYDVSAANTATAWAVGEDGIIIKTTDGGDERPDIVSLNPASGPVGTEVTLVGCDFGSGQGSSYISFGPVVASDYLSWSDSQIICRVPQGVSGEVQVTVTTVEGSSNPLAFQVIPPPLTVSGITPPYGISGTIFPELITGSGFQPGAKVRIERPSSGTVIEASDVVAVSDSQIACKFNLTSAPLGRYDLIVENPDGQETKLPGGYRVVNVCGIGGEASLLAFGLMMGLLSIAASGILRGCTKG